MQKDRVTVTLDPDLVMRLDRLAEIHDDSRSGMMERLLARAVEAEEETLEQLGSPVIGGIVQSIVDHPMLVSAIAKLIGEKLTAKDYEKIQQAGPKFRRTREKLKNQRGRRHDLQGEGA